MFRKIRFISARGVTAGLVIGTAHAKWRVSELSRLFPMWEARRMSQLQASPWFKTFEEAFNYTLSG